MKAVHFGAGNIGRGFVGLLLSEAGYEVVFSDVDASLIGALREAGSYTVHEVGDGARDHLVTGFRAVDGRVDEDALVEEIATADVVTTAVGPNVLRFVAPAIAAGLLARSPKRPPLVVMACENAIRATDTLRACVVEEAADRAAEAEARAIFANTAVDRIVPGVPGGEGLDVTVEAFHEWVIEGPPFDGNPPAIPGAHVVDDLDPYIERKLFTVNTGHAATAYIGFLRGAETIAEAISTPEVADAVRAALEETSALLVEKHGLDERQQAAYRERILARFANPHLPDTVVRVGRQPLRKLSRHERFIGPAAEIAEAGREPSALLAAVSAALRFDVPSDDESVDLRELLGSQDADAFTAEVTGLEASHPLYAAVRAAVAEAQAAR